MQGYMPWAFFFFFFFFFFYLTEEMIISFPIIYHSMTFWNIRLVHIRLVLVWLESYLLSYIRVV